jgi:predicted RNase H-like HicB family nuclease
MCRGTGDTKEEAIEKLKEEIDFYNKSAIKTEQKMNLEKMVNNIFPKDPFSKLSV